MAEHREYELAPGGIALRLGRTARLMGILNVTPDSFSDGGRFDAVPATDRPSRRKSPLEFDSDRMHRPHRHAHECELVLDPLREIAPEVAAWIATGPRSR